MLGAQRTKGRRRVAAPFVCFFVWQSLDNRAPPTWPDKRSDRRVMSPRTPFCAARTLWVHMTRK
jgi:hypothetical protein